MNDGFAQVQRDRRGEASAPLATANDVHVPLACVRDTITAAQSRLESRFRQGEPVDTLVETRSRFVDGILVLAWRRFGLDDRDARHALVAVGGYGRGELHPGSDIDLLILAQRAMRDGESDRIRSFLAFLWDIGLAVGNSVRTVRECVNEARRDVTVATNLMEGRLVCGSADLFARMRERTGPKRIWSSRRFFEAKMTEQRERHRKFDDTGHNLEPNVKEGPGGPAGHPDHRLGRPAPFRGGNTRRTGRPWNSHHRRARCAPIGPAFSCGGCGSRCTY